MEEGKFMGKVKLTNEKKNTKEDDLKENFCQEYKQFLSGSKTERECIKFFSNLLNENGFIKLENAILERRILKKGDKVYAINMNKALVAFIVGSSNFEYGMNILCAHIDSPRLDLKNRPVYDDSEFCMLDTHYYGGIKKYQWTTLPLALHGLVCKKDGTKIDIKIGEDEDDPVLGVTDLLPHLDKATSQGNIQGEKLDLVAGTKTGNGSAKEAFLNVLKKLNIDEDDLISSEIEVVPAGKARDFGLDRSMIMGYGHDDRALAFTCIKALLNSSKCKRPQAVVLADKEEIGSIGATGMKSKFFENMVAEVMALAGEYNELKFKRCLNKSKVISCDVTAAFDPNWPDPSNKLAEARFNHGIAFCKYGGSKGKSGSNDANPEYIAVLRKLMDENNVKYQFTEMGKVDAGGGGTVSFVFAEYGMEVIDAGIPVLSMHAPWEVVSKFDLFESYKFYKIFLEHV